MSSKTSSATNFAHEAATNVSSVTTAAVVALRVVLGWSFFYSGVTKVMDPTWTASGYLQNAVAPTNPFASVWPMLASVPLIDVLVQWGLLLTGLGLMVGGLVRWNAFWASFMMLMFWASSLPLERAILVDNHIIYIAALAGLAALGAGRVAGVDAFIESSSLVERYPRLRYLLG
ncbi:DoxX family membrane protein [Halomarina litorea]|uniref:DoxX family membrane protein n=1 Tax=Halomarina litorea TaxID=2961595 RepID=UPI0020C1C4ED|nr:DoxX family membrane protein [Halomarina sp. BCD28]